jgi:hypothetical protein
MPNGDFDHPEAVAWSDAARRHLEPVVTAAFRVRAGLALDSSASSASTLDLASKLLTACSNLLTWLGDSPAQSGHELAETELFAAVGVFKNVAFVYRSLDGAEPGRRDARAEACKSMLAQGEYHVETFLALTARAPGTGGP